MAGDPRCAAASPGGVGRALGTAPGCGRIGACASGLGAWSSRWRETCTLFIFWFCQRQVGFGDRVEKPVAWRLQCAEGPPHRAATPEPLSVFPDVAGLEQARNWRLLSLCSSPSPPLTTRAFSGPRPRDDCPFLTKEPAHVGVHTQAVYSSFCPASSSQSSSIRTNARGQSRVSDTPPSLSVLRTVLVPPDAPSQAGDLFRATWGWGLWAQLAGRRPRDLEVAATLAGRCVQTLKGPTASGPCGPVSDAPFSLWRVITCC